jgi:beta-glucuronidase
MKQHLFCLALFTGCLAASAAAQPVASNLIINIPGRQTVSLDGTWNAIVDPYENGLSQRFYENRKPKSKSDLIEYDFDTAGTLTVPGDWNTQRSDLMFYEGPVWYQRYFTFHKQPDTRVFLYFGAANYLSRVYLNGQKLGEHGGGYTPFNFEVTSLLADGQNSLVVEVDDTRRPDGVPAPNTDWWNYGGLTRSVKLVEVPNTFIQQYDVQLAKGSMNEISGWVKLNGVTSPQTVSIEIPEIQLKQNVTTNASGEADFHFPAKLTLWSPQNPKLYRVVLSSGNDTVADEIGFRSITTRGTQILLNGKPIFLRGIDIHEEAPFHDGRIVSVEQDRILLGWAKDLGCNFVRMAHYPYNEAMIRSADRMGVLLWEEVPVYWQVEWSNPATLDNAESQLRDEITRDRNRAAVILWSLSNETYLSPERLQFIKSMALYARTLDNTRLLTSAMDKVDRPSKYLHELNDPLGQYLDVLGLNEYIGWYEGALDDISQTRWKFAYNKPVVISETGAAALYGRHGDPDERWTEEYQANLYKRQFEMFRHMPQLSGISPWVLEDFRSPRRALTIQNFHNLKGLISKTGERKQAFYVLQKFYHDMGESPRIPSQ